MPRRPRISLAGVPVHLVQRGNNRHACFFADEDYFCYLRHLKILADTFDCAVHAYVLMTNHVHLLVTPKSVQGVSLLMKHLGQCYVQYVNRSYQRSGTLWEGRFRSCIVQSEAYLLHCHRYIELNPVRANMVEHPRHYRWSSYRTNAEGRADTMIKPHEIFGQLGMDEKARRAAYCALFSAHIDPQTLTAIRRATNGNFALGDSRFSQQIEEQLGRRVERRHAGRPRKCHAPDHDRQAPLI